MPRAYSANIEMAKNGGGGSCTNPLSSCTISQQISDLFRSLHPLKTWSVIGDLLGLSERAAKYRVAGTRPYTVDELRTILRSEDGLEFYEMLMEGCESEGWKWLSKEIRLSKARRKQAEAEQEVLSLEDAPVDPRTRRKVRKFHNANRNLNTAFAQTETALGFSRPDPVRGIHSPVAEAGRKAKAAASAGRATGGRPR